MLDLDRIKEARLGAFLSGSDKTHENEGAADGTAGRPCQLHSSSERLISSASSSLSQLRSDLKAQEGTLAATIGGHEQKLVSATQAAEDIKLARLSGISAYGTKLAI